MLPQERNYLIKLARQSIEHFLYSRDFLNLDRTEVGNLSPVLLEKRACFVTLTKNGELRGCIGHLEAVQPLYLDVIENAVGAAFKDDRFLPVASEELPDIQVEISILSAAVPVVFDSVVELLENIRPGIDGVVIRKGNNGATYLPQVWEEIFKKEEYLSSLCLKAGLPSEAWKELGMRFWTYQVESILEEVVTNYR